MAFRSLLPHAARDGQPNAMTCNYDGLTTSQVVEALRLDHAWDDLDGDLPRRKQAKKLKFTLLAALTRVVMGFPMRGQRVGMGGLCA
jgi:hypothetical protein